MAKYPGMINIQVLTSPEKLDQLETEWNELVRSIPAYLPTMTFQWHKAWLEVNQSKILKVHFFVFRDKKERLIGIVPLIRMEAQLFLKKLQVYTFSGARDQIQTLIICKNEHHVQILLELLSHFYHKHSDWHLLALRRLSSSKADEVFLERILNKYHWPFSVESHLQVPYIRLEGDFETYLKSRKRHFRHEIKRKTKQLRNMGNLIYSFKAAPLSDADFAQFVALEDAGWKGQNRSSLKHRPDLYRLFKKLSQVNTEELKLVQFNLSLEGKLISSSLCLQTLDGLHVFKIAFDEGFKKQSPGLLLRLFEIEYAFKQGLKVYDFSGKEQPWMRAFTERRHHVMDYIIYRKTLFSLIRYLGFTRLRPLIKQSSLTEQMFKKMIRD